MASEADYSRYSKTDELILFSTIFRVSLDTDACLPKIKKYAIAGKYLSNIGNVFHDFVRACLECTRRVGARAEPYHKFLPLRMVRQKNAATLERAKAQQD